MTDTVQFELVSPAKLLLSEDVEMVVVPGGEGDFGVLPGHTPMLTTVRPGIIDIYENDKIAKRIFVEGGFAEVSGTRCAVLAEEAIALDELNRDHAEARLQKANDALQAADNDIAKKDAERELRAAEAMLAACGA
ncbi:MAG: F0F1 ATP synthase subunit epsilon [Terasakiella sp.]|jgi:F-type H+-transporting ATPase subunit epsilon|uniref:ATP synthase epsilon chain n=1 Tax=Terasakiella brassicae TaxID=1634917 RepID=A0A917C6I0_9PROT|nr:F0F1 ATP synthase subunit epsilon [Terasakiella brassicae]GGF72608.1 ATP synthase epsilon chain [Terasakiella brassicae]